MENETEKMLEKQMIELEEKQKSFYQIRIHVIEGRDMTGMDGTCVAASHRHLH